MKAKLRGKWKKNKESLETAHSNRIAAHIRSLSIVCYVSCLRIFFDYQMVWYLTVFSMRLYEKRVLLSTKTHNNWLQFYYTRFHGFNAGIVHNTQQRVCTCTAIGGLCWSYVVWLPPQELYIHVTKQQSQQQRSISSSIQLFSCSVVRCTDVCERAMYFAVYVCSEQQAKWMCMSVLDVSEQWMGCIESFVVHIESVYMYMEKGTATRIYIDALV